MKVGDKIWVFDANRRVYPERKVGSSFNPPIWREHWRPEQIIGENRLNFIVGSLVFGGKPSEWDLKNGLRIPKKGPVPSHVALSEEEVDRRTWVHDHHYKIGKAIDDIRDYDLLKKIAELIGYKE